MSHKNTARHPSHVTLHWDAFGGYDKTAGDASADLATSIVNFRIRDDGALEKRHGFRQFKNVGAPIRAFWNGILMGEPVAFLLAESTVYLLKLESATLTAIAQVASTEGEGCFFFEREHLYLLDGERLYLLNETGAHVAQCYVPLYGKDWDNNTMGPIHEPRNILTPLVRISYIVSDPPTIFLAVPDPIASVDAVYKNGTLLSPEEYQIDTRFNSVNVVGMAAGDRVTLCVRLANHSTELEESFYSCKSALAFGCDDTNRLFFWGGNQPSLMFCSSYVTDASLFAAQADVPDCCSLYLPLNYEFRVGEGLHAIQGVIRQYDRLLIFTDGDVWMASPSTSGLEEFPTTAVNSSIGCVSPQGYALMLNDPVTLGRQGIYRWSGETERLSERNATKISEPIDGLYTPSELATAELFYHAATHELWFNVKAAKEIWICNLRRGAWFRYDGIPAEKLFDLNGQVCFLSGGRIYIFSDLLSMDYPASTVAQSIVAVYETGVTDFGTEQQKNLTEVVVRQDGKQSQLEVALIADETKTTAVTLSDPEEKQHAVLRRRLRSPRFRSAKIRLRSASNTKLVLHSLTLRTR